MYALLVLVALLDLLAHKRFKNIRMLKDACPRHSNGYILFYLIHGAS